MSSNGENCNGVDINSQNGTNGTNKDNQITFDVHFATRALHAGQDPSQWTSRAVVPPISMSTTFAQYSPGNFSGFDYGRSGNPTRKCLEEAIASLEEAQYALCFASGLSAQLNVTHLLSAGDHILCFDDVYGGTNRYFRTVAARLGLEISFADARDPQNVLKALKPNTRLVWMETPTNPTMKLVDIKAVAAIVKREAPEAIYVVDNTFMSSYFQQPLSLGADIAMHSLTKYMNGHADVVMGAIATNSKDIYDKLKYLQNSLGAVPSPFDCFLVNRGLKTLAVRMDKHQENGLAVARFLESHPMVKKVIHPGLKSHPQHELALRQCSGFSGMVSAYIEGDGETASVFIKNLKLFILAESLGSVESLIEIPALMTHQSLPKETREMLGISDTLIRLSVGIEATEDLLSDLSQALNIAKEFYDRKVSLK
ncbi:cystathionine gamma-lyase-like [Oppia nitens]|uniref:cystathionine gamma-lyase-like n=1 Tax=Oppia nitens TaxID=1686743 RepID=UPI0023DC7D73|nr:cystathionine gamma-lyase-like [Oppia nitens]